MWVRSKLLTRSGLKVKKWNKYLNHCDLNIYSISCSATANLLLSAQRNTFSLTSSTCKKLNNDERSVTKILFYLSAAPFWSGGSKFANNQIDGFP